MNTWSVRYDDFLKKLLFNLSVHACMRARLGSVVRGLIISDVIPQERCLPHFDTRSLIGLESTPVWIAQESQESACISRITSTCFQAWLFNVVSRIGLGKARFY